MIDFAFFTSIFNTVQTITTDKENKFTHEIFNIIDVPFGGKKHYKLQ